MNTKTVVINGQTITLSKVASIKPVGPKPVYDLEVRDVHNYFAGGINVHNCDYHKMLDEVGAKHGEELYKLKDSFVQYRHRKLKVYPAGPDKRVLRGRTRYLAGIDELGWFPNGADAIKLVKLNADEVYTSLANSLSTVRAAAEGLLKKGFNNVPPAYFVNLSSPSSVRDKMMELVRKSLDSRKLFGIQLATWFANPKMPRSYFDENFARDPVGSMRDYGAQPPIANSPLISNVDLIVKAASTKAKNPIQVKYEINKGSAGSSTRYARIVGMKDGVHPSILAIDAGYSNNSFAIAVGHKVDARRNKIDLLVEVQPLPGVPLNYTKIFKNIVGPLIQRRNVVLITADRWNSIKLLQDAEEEYEIEAKQYSLKYKDMVLFKDYFEAGQLQYPKPDWTLDEVLAYEQNTYPACFARNPVEHFMLQCVTVQDTGTAVLKGDQLTDDLVRASMLLNYQLLNPDYAELLSQGDAAVKSSVNVQQSIAVRLGSNASGSTSSSMYKSVSGRAIGIAKARAM